MTKSEMGYTDYGHIGPLLLFLNQYFNNFLPEVYVLYIALIWCTYDLLVYCSQVSRIITFLHIYFIIQHFTVQYYVHFFERFYHRSVQYS